MGKVTKTREVWVCDNCGVEVDHVEKCSKCGREICTNCSAYFCSYCIKPLETELIKLPIMEVK